MMNVQINDVKKADLEAKLNIQAFYDRYNLNVILFD